jgi:nucleotide-binding universal stress UspA family protein
VVCENVVVLLDGSPLAEAVVEPSVELARLLEARCTLFRVVEGRAGSAATAAPVAEAEAYLKGIAGKVGGEGVRVERRVVVGEHAAECILDEGRAHLNQLLALATHGRGGIRRRLLGSVTDRIVRGCVAPVLIHRPWRESSFGCNRSTVRSPRL